MYIEGKPVLHLVDEATRFQAGHWLKNVSAEGPRVAAAEKKVLVRLGQK